MATRTPQQIRDYLAYQGINYQPGGIFPEVEGSGTSTVPSGFYMQGENPTANLMSLEDISRRYPDISVSELQQALPLFSMPASYAKATPSRGGGFFSMLTDLVTSPQFLMAGSVIAPSLLAAGGAAAPAAAGAAGAAGAAPAATLGAADLAALDAGLGGLPATGYPVVTSPLAAPSVLAGDTLGASLSGLTPEQIAAATSSNALGVGAGAPAAAGGANALAPVFDPASAMETQLTATGTPAAVSPAAAATAANAASNALAPSFDPASAAETQLTATPDVTGLPAGAFDTLAKFAKDYGVPLASLISGITGSQAAQSAAETQARSAAEARQLARDIFNEQKALQEPFRTAGITAQNQLLTLLGLPGGTQGAEFGRYARPFGMQDFQADPGYAFRLSEGLKALEASRAAKGGLLSGATGKALSRYGQDLASQEYGNAFNRYQTERVNRLQPLGALMGTGQAAAANQGAAAGQYGQTAGGLTTDIGAVTAGGQLGAARAISNALSAYGNYMGNQNLAQAIRESQYNR